MIKKMLFPLLIFTLAACGGGDADEAIPSAPTLAVAAATPTLAATNTLPPPAVVEPAETATPLPVDADSPAEEPVSLFTAADFGDDRNPLTGELVEDTSLLQQRPLAVKISNAPPGFVRPQSGLNDAAFIFEHTAEGSITRFTAIIYGELPEKIGPIRSARLIDVELPAIFDAGLAFSGASVGVNQRLNASDFVSRIIRSNEQGYYRTGENKPVEHTLYGDPQGFLDALEAKGENSPPNFGTTLAFTSEPPEGGEPATQAVIDYQWEEVEWRYNEEDGRYYRWADGQPVLDANDGEQVSAANVVIIAPFHVEDPTICEEIRNDQCVHLSVQIQLWGSGGGTILRDGQQYPVTWVREGRNDLLTFTDGDGNPFPLQIGNSWVQLIPTWYRDPVTITP